MRDLRPWLVVLVVAACSCGARETYIPQPPDPADFGVEVADETGHTADTGLPQ